MPEAKKAAKPRSPAKPRSKATVKAKVVEPASKAAFKKSKATRPVVEAKAKRTRGPNRKATGSFAVLRKKQAELEEIKKGAKADLRKQYERLLKDSEKVKAQYKELFSESIEFAPKARGAGARKASGRGYTLEQVKLFIEQTERGEKIKIPGKNATGIARMKAAYEKAKDKDAESVKKLLK
jgi:hypothetical protein